MSTDPSEPGARQERVNEAVATYRAAAATGQPPDRAEFLERHADIRTELEAFFAERDRQQQVTQAAAEPPVRDTPTVAPGSSGASQPLLGTVRYFGDYELLSEIARGGMGVVFKARQVSLDRLVALKMILAGPLAAPSAVQRFHTEARAAANLKHPNIVPIHEVGVHQGQHFFSMDYVAGKNLADVVRENPLPPEKAARYTQKIARAVHHAHQQGTLHRDLKPSNVLIDEADEPHVTDFGLAKQVNGEASLTASGQVLGTPSYMSPEQATGRHADVGPASDVYSLGALLYELLTGRPPFRAESALLTMKQVTETDPVPPRLLNPALPRDLDTICLKCLEKDPRQRYASGQELAEDLGRYLAGELIRARPPSIPFVVRHWFRQNLRTTTWVIVIGAVAGLLASLGPLGYRQLNAARMRALYAQFPSVAPPSTLWPDWLPAFSSDMTDVLLFLLCPLALCGGPFLAGVIVRPSSLGADIAVGAASGVVTGLTLYVCGMGSFAISSEMLRSLPDIRLLADAAAHHAGASKANEGDDPVNAKYPELATRAPREQFAVLAQKIATDMIANSVRAPWGCLLLVFLAALTGIIFAPLAGIVARRGDRTISSALAEENWSIFLITMAAGIALSVFSWSMLEKGYTLWMMSGFVGAVSHVLGKQHLKLNRGELWRRDLWVTVLLALTFLVSWGRFLTLGLQTASPWPWYVDIVVYALTAYVVGRQLRRHGVSAFATNE